MLQRTLLAILLLALPLAAQNRVFRVDANHTVFGFKASTPLFDVPGRFNRYQADIQGDPGDPAGAKVRIQLDAASISTANDARDKHLRSEDFFDVKQFPALIFTSSEVRKDGERLRVSGTLQMHGVSKKIELDFQPFEGLNGAGSPTWSYRASLPLDRLDYGLGAASVAAKIGLNRKVELDLLLVGAFEPVKKAAGR